jgi:adenylate cyclase
LIATTSTAARILVVDDTPRNVKLLADLLAVKGYEVLTAASGAEALEQVTRARPDLVLLDVVMPGMTGYEVCRRIRADPAGRILPVVMVTALDPAEERIKGIEAGADDFLTKPINQPELLARVRSLLRIKSLYVELEESNRTLEQRVAEQVEQLERLSRLKRFFSPQLAELILSGGAEDPLKSHRREITVVFLDLRGFTAFAETAEPEEVMGVLRDYHAQMGRIIMAHDGTLERFAGDGWRCTKSCTRSPRNGKSTASSWILAQGSRRVTPRSAQSASRGGSTMARSGPSPISPPACAARPSPARS